MTRKLGQSLAATLILTAMAGQALGQNALGNGTEMGNKILGDRARNGLGDGRGLDTNTLVGSIGRNNQVRDFQAEMRFRNSIVTGNAPNGLSFRGDIPYYAPQDFRGNTGSNDLYSFRRDSLYSGLAGMGIRGTEALQQQFALQTGNRLPELLTGSLTVNRFGAGDPDYSGKLKNKLAPVGLAPMGDPAVIGRPDPSELTPDFSGLQFGNSQQLGTLRSTSAYTSTRNTQQTLLDIRTTPNNDLIGVAASGLRGIQSIPLGKATAENNINNARNNFAAGSIAQQNGARPNIPSPAGTNPITSSRPMTDAAAGGAAYVDLMSRLSAYAGATNQSSTDARPDWQKNLDALRLELSNSDLGVSTPPAPGETPAAPLPSEGAAFVPSALQPLPPVKNFRFDATTVDTLRNASGQINSLVPLTDASADAYTGHMQVGQSELNKGRFFDAEEAFTRAIAVRPDDTMALVGRIHAQLGAGMNLSAWMNLRELFKNHPELLGAKYGAGLLPDAERLREIEATLNKLIERGGSLHREAAMLLAYVGYQTGDATALEQGLTAMQNAKEGQADALTDLMDAVWSGKQPAPEAGAVTLPAEPAPAEPPSAVDGIK